ncbi:MAG: flagellar basal-body MS-ring/collar protein FliF, partial [Gemmata sp.]
METLRRLLSQMREYWAGLGLARRVLIAGAGIGVLLAVATVAYLSGTTYVPVYRDLALEEASAMRTSLQGLNIPVQLSADGTAVLVPQERAAEAKVALAGAGLPTRGGKGYELFDETSLMTTPFVQSVNYQRALQAELSRSIGQLESVQSARVLIAKPEPSPFIRDQRQPTASVILKLKPGAVMSRTAAAGVVSLVARSVEGLKPENVTVVDSGGRLLSDPHAADRDALPTPHLEYRRELEAYLAEKAERMLAQHLGPGRAVVQVSADINFQRLKETTHTYQAGVPRSELTQTSKSNGGGTGGVAGAASNVARSGGGAPLNSRGGGGSTSSDETIRTDYALPETIRSVEDGLGAVTRLSIAALVDLNPQGEGQTVISAADASELIQRAIGFRTGRDEVKVTNARLAGPTGPTGPAEPDDTLARLQRFQAYVGLARNLSLALAAFLVVLIVALLALRRRSVPAPVAPAPQTAEERRRA